MKKILLSLLCTISAVAMAPPPGGAQLNGHAFYLLIKGIQDWFEKRNKPNPNPPTPAPMPTIVPPFQVPKVQSSSSLQSMVQVYFDEKNQKLVVVTPEGIEVDLLRSAPKGYVKFPPFQEPADDE